MKRLTLCAVKSSGEKLRDFTASFLVTLVMARDDVTNGK